MPVPFSLLWRSAVGQTEGVRDPASTYVHVMESDGRLQMKTFSACGLITAFIR